MSLPREEARALNETWEFLLGLSSGRIKVTGNVTELRRQARRLSKHYPLAAGPRWLEMEALFSEHLDKKRQDVLG